MTYCVINTETSGLFDYNKPADADGQPRLASLAMIHLDDDLAETSREMHWVKPDGWALSYETIELSGMTNEFLAVNGDPVGAVCAAYDNVISEGAIIVAYNAPFHMKMMRAELRRATMPDRFEETCGICLMRAATNIVKALKKIGKGYKFPKLEESCRHFGIVSPNAHSAMSYAQSAAEVFRALRDRGALPEPTASSTKANP